MKTPTGEARELVEYAEALAEGMLDDMTGEECVQMVRDFCGVMADWQPNIRENLEDPIMLGLHCLAAADLFKQAFVKAYKETSSRLEAQEAIEKALGGLQ